MWESTGGKYVLDAFDDEIKDDRELEMLAELVTGLALDGLPPVTLDGLSPMALDDLPPVALDELNSYGAEAFVGSAATVQPNKEVKSEVPEPMTHKHVSQVSAQETIAAAGVGNIGSLPSGLDAALPKVNPVLIGPFFSVKEQRQKTGKSCGPRLRSEIEDNYNPIPMKKTRLTGMALDDLPPVVLDELNSYGACVGLTTVQPNKEVKSEVPEPMTHKHVSQVSAQEAIAVAHVGNIKPLPFNLDTVPLRKLDSVLTGSFYSAKEQPQKAAKFCGTRLRSELEDNHNPIPAKKPHL